MGDYYKHYETIEELGRGGMGVVFLARQVSLNRLVALKVLSVEDQDEVDLRRFRREAKGAMNLSHPNIAKLLDCDLEAVPPYLVFEYVAGGRPLLNVIMKEPPPFPRALAIAQRIAAGVAHIHGHGIIHRDLKPGNILIDGEGRPRVIDLGLCRKVTAEQTRLTQTGFVVGTHAYMSPEQMLGEPAGFASDVYAMGLILYELIAGTIVFGSAASSGVSPSDRLARRIPPVQSHGKTIPPVLERLLTRCLSLDPSQRPKDGGELEQELARVVQGRSGADLSVLVAPPDSLAPFPVQSLPSDPTRLGVPLEPTPPGSSPPESPRFQARWLLPLALVGLAAYGIGRYQAVPPLAPRATPASASSPVAGAGSGAGSEAKKLLGALVAAAKETEPAALARLVKELGTAGLKDPARARAVIRTRLQARGLPGPVEEYLAWSNRSDPAASWRVTHRDARSLLCGVALWELFCAEHQIAWVMDRSIVAWLDTPEGVPEPWKLDLQGARTWMRYSGEDGLALARGSVTEEVWECPLPGPGERALLWYGALDWHPGLVIDARVNGSFRTVMRCTTERTDLPAVPAWVLQWTAGADVRGAEHRRILGDQKWNGSRTYLAAWIPRAFLAPRNTVRLQTIDLPQSRVFSIEAPRLVDRMWTLVHVPAR